MNVTRTADQSEKEIKMKATLKATALTLFLILSEACVVILTHNLTAY